MRHTKQRGEKIMEHAIDFATADLDVVLAILKEIFDDDLLSSPDVGMVTTALENDAAPCPKVLATDDDVESLVRHFDTLRAEWGPDVIGDFPEPPVYGEVR
jgi:hypothetical protein